MSGNFDLDEIEDSISETPVTIKRTKNGDMLISPRSVYRMASMGWNGKEIAKMLCIDDNTLYKHFNTELQMGKATIAPRLKANILRQALAYDKPNPTILLFAAKNWAGMTEEGFREQDEDKSAVEFRVKAPTLTIPLSAPDEEPGEDE